MTKSERVALLSTAMRALYRAHRELPYEMDSARTFLAVLYWEARERWMKAATASR